MVFLSIPVTVIVKEYCMIKPVVMQSKTEERATLRILSNSYAYLGLQLQKKQITRNQTWQYPTLGLWIE